ncbi:Periplasmic thiol:disulfide oxidoreductase DsbB, required for DsbA reoxidation [plant metagenome]|uniref:Periplasmic thiol:disulfide oxidoreductase DsbB, required for DsbA reoxidation n=1 Tax=plant metagenome TaxID=1297885 RepID=A0A484Q273_9ZZZZ
MKRLTLDAALAGVLFLCLTAVCAALVSQHVFGMLPCPWCILQRVIFLAIALLCALALALRRRPVQRVLAGAGALMAAGGVAAAVYQNQVAAQMFSCNLTLADRIIGALGLEAAVPFLFRISASCMEGAVDLLGLPYEYWSGGLFVVVALVLVSAMFLPQRVALSGLALR